MKKETDHHREVPAGVSEREEGRASLFARLRRLTKSPRKTARAPKIRKLRAILSGILFFWTASFPVLLFLTSMRGNLYWLGDFPFHFMPLYYLALGLAGIVVTGNLAARLNRSAGAWVAGTLMTGGFLALALLALPPRSGFPVPARVSEKPREDVQRAILRLARDNGGTVTRAEAALAVNLPLEETNLVLEDLARLGYADMQVDDRGQLRFVFCDFRKEEPFNGFLSV